MSRRLLLLLAVLELLCCSFHLRTGTSRVSAADGQCVRNLNTGLSYATIQGAINALETLNGHALFAGSGTYCEHVVLNKTLTLAGEGSNTTIIDGNLTGTVVTVEADNVKITGFTIQNSGNLTENNQYPVNCGIKLFSDSHTVRNATIENCTIINNLAGIYARFSNDDTVIRNVFSNNLGPPFSFCFNSSSGQYYWEGSEDDVFFVASNASAIRDNRGQVSIWDSTANDVAGCSGQVFLSASSNNTITYCSDRVSLISSDKNVIAHCSGTIAIARSNDNLIRNNVLSPNESIYIPEASFSRISTSCERNLVVDNVLKSGNIYIGSNDATLSNNNMVTNNTLVGGSIKVSGSNNVISRNKVSETTETAIYVHAQDSPVIDFHMHGNNTISQNEISNSTVGIFIGSSTWNNRITNNTVCNNSFGLYLNSPDNLLRDNQMLGNTFNMFMRGHTNDIDTSNTVNRKPVFYLINRTDLDVNPETFPEVGYLGLIGCSNVTVRNLRLTDNGEGIILSQCMNCKIEENIIENNLEAVSIDANNTSFSGNLVCENIHGITLEGYFNQIENNTISHNTLRLAPQRWPKYWSIDDHFDLVMEGLMKHSGGIFLHYADNNTLSNNNITNNEQGILLCMSGFNTLKNNRLEGNIHSFGVDPIFLYPIQWVIAKPVESMSPYLLNYVDTSNTVNGKPIYWWMNRHDEQVPADAGCVILVNSTNMVIRDLVLENNTEGMLLVDVNSTIISNNTLVGSRYGILMKPGFPAHKLSNNTITHNSMTTNGVAIYLGADNCTISNNLLQANLVGIYISGNDNNLIIGNLVTGNTYPSRDEWLLEYSPVHYVLISPLSYWQEAVGITLDTTNGSIVRYNTVQNNDIGITTIQRGGFEAENYWIYRNNFINNTSQAALGSLCRWASGYPSGGNYWSDYSGTDGNQTLYQNQTGSDGIGDTPYHTGQWGFFSPIPEIGSRMSNQYDPYPLMAPIATFYAGTWNYQSYTVDIISNSTVSEFRFNPSEGALLRFSVADKAGTSGFCRVTIPKDILIVEGGYTVLVNLESVNSTSLIDETNAYLYFVYNHTAGIVRIIGTHVIPELPSIVILPLLMLAILSAVVVHKKR